MWYSCQIKLIFIEKQNLMKIQKTFIGLLFLFGIIFHANAQVFNIGGKYSEKSMFQASINVPLLFDKDKPYDFALGLDYTTGNKLAPSGLQPQLTAMYFLVDDKNKSYLVSANLSAGYLFDFNKHFDNEIRVSPHLYLEFILMNIKVGYDYLMSSQKGYPFISIGFGGGHLFRHFSVM